MREYMDVICSSELFAGISPPEAEAMLGCLNARVHSCERGGYILRSGGECGCMGLVLSGSAHVVRDDFWGRRDIIAELQPGGTFAESYACTPGALLTVDVLAASDCRVLFVDARRALTTCPAACAFHARLIRNLLSVIAASNLRLNEKLNHVTRRSTREKLLSYLSAQARRAGAATFTIPFDRQQLADYLSVDRCAMSSELGRMRNDGLIEFERSRFTLIQADFEKHT